MIILYLMAFLLLVLPIPVISAKGEFNESYLSQTNILPIKGFFTLLVFFRHAKGYFDFDDGLLDSSFLLADRAMAQLIVAMFFFYSGYGIYENIKEKGHDYITAFPKNRLLRIWMRFAVCVSLFYFFNLLRGRQLGLKTMLLAFVGWESIGNSNWFMCVTFALYLIVFFGLVFMRNPYSTKGVMVVTVLSAFLVIILMFLRFDSSWWWNTILCFPLGMWFSIYRNKVEDCLFRANRYIKTLCLMMGLLVGSYVICLKISMIAFLFASLFFSCIVVLLTMKIQVRNFMLIFLGRHVFSIYMLQRLAFLIFRNIIYNKYICFVVCLFVTILVSVIFDKVAGAVENVLWAGSNRKKVLRRNNKLFGGRKA